jgi:hypothetical protein
LLNLFDFALVELVEVDPVLAASFVRVGTLATVEAEQKLTVLTSAHIFSTLDIRDALATRHRTPANVFHLCYSSVQTVFFILFLHYFRQA